MSQEFRQTSFAGGEFAPTLHSRSDLDRYATGLARALNVFVTEHGVLKNRSGTRLVCEVAGSKAARLRRFSFSSDQSYALEFTDKLMRLVHDGGLVEASPGVPFSLATPYVEADLARLKMAQQGDVISIAHRDYEPGELQRASHTDWAHVSAGVRRASPYTQYDAAATYAVGDIVRATSSVGSAFDTFFKSLVAANVGNTPYSSGTKWAAVAGLEEHLPPSEVMFLARERTFMATGSYMAAQVTTIEAIDQTGDESHPAKEWQWVVTAVYGDGLESVASPVLMPAATADKATSRKVVLYPDKAVILTWLACPGAVAYRFYRGRSGLFGYVGEAQPSKVAEGLGGGLFQDDALTPDWTRQPPTGRWPFGVQAWKPLSQYFPGDLYFNSLGSVYRCAVGGLTGITEPSVCSDGLIVDGVETAWVKNTAYVVGDRVISQEGVYECTRDHTSSNATDAPGPWGTGFYAFSVNYSLNEAQTVAGTQSWKYQGSGSAAQWEYVCELADYAAANPDVVIYHEGRRYYASLGRIQASCVADYANFDVSNPVRDDEACDFTLAAQEFEEIRSLASMDGGLVALGVAAEWLLTGAGQNEPISPTSILARVGSQRGSSWLDPVIIGAALLHAQPRGGRVRELLWDGSRGTYAGNDLSIYSRHLLAGRTVVDWCYQETPDSIVWLVLDDGTMLSLTYHREQEMAAWTQHSFPGGLVESVCSVPEGTEDAVYVVMKRGTKRYIERFASRDIDPDDSATWRFLDSSLTYDASPATVFSGLGHLEGQVVHALVDGVPAGPFTVSGGSIDISATFPSGGSKVTVGLQYSIEIETLPYPGPPRGVMKSISKIALEVESAAAAMEAGVTLAHTSVNETRDVVDAYGAIPLKTREIQIRPPSRWEQVGSVALRVTSPTPVTLLAVRREIEMGGR